LCQEKSGNLARDRNVFLPLHRSANQVKFAPSNSNQFHDWSQTGGAGVRQPDNREGGESCMAVLNNFYGDGIKWHDVACHHKKPTFCELPPPPRFFH
jgi:hypothetical protein